MLNCGSLSTKCNHTGGGMEVPVTPQTQEESGEERGEKELINTDDPPPDRSRLLS